MSNLNELLTPPGFAEKDNVLEFPRHLSRTYHLLVWPSDVGMDWLREIYAQADVDVSVYVFPYDKYYVMTKLNRMATRAKAHYQLQIKRGHDADLPEIEAVLEDVENLRRAVQRGWERLFKVSLLITVYAQSREELDRKCSSLETVLAGLSARAVPCIFNQREAYQYNLPLMLLPSVQSEVKSRDVTLGGAAFTLPVVNDHFSHPSGAFLGFSGSGSPVFFDPFIGPPDLPNPHIAVFGYTGAGKSVTLKIMSSRLSLLNVKVLVLDWEGEYEKCAVNLAGGQVIKIDPNKPSGINPFEIEPETEGGKTFVNISEKVADIRSLLAAIVHNYAARSLSAVEMSSIEEAIREEYAARNINESPESLFCSPSPLSEEVFMVGKTKKPLPTLSTFYERLKTKPGTEQICAEIKPFLKGNSMGIFDCESSLDLSAPFTVVDISKIRDEFTRFYAMFVILSWAWHRFASLPGPKIIVNDEAWMFMKYPESASFLETLARRGRKRQAGLVIASQHIEEFLKNDQGKAVISSCATKLLLAQSSSAIPEIMSVFKLPPSAGEALQNLREGRGFLMVKDNITFLEVFMADFEKPFVETGGAIDG